MSGELTSIKAFFNQSTAIVRPYVEAFSELASKWFPLIVQRSNVKNSDGSLTQGPVVTVPVYYTSNNIYVSEKSIAQFSSLKSKIKVYPSPNGSVLNLLSNGCRSKPDLVSYIISDINT